MRDLHAEPMYNERLRYFVEQSSGPVLRFQRTPEKCPVLGIITHETIKKAEEQGPICIYTWEPEVEGWREYYERVRVILGWAKWDSD